MAWIKTEDARKPEMNEVYWVTCIFGETLTVIPARYTWQSRRENLSGGKCDPVAWWPAKRPEPAKLEKKAPYLVFPEYKTGSNGVNIKIKARLLPDTEMRKLGFTDYREGYWYFSKILRGSIIFSVTVSKADADDFRIDVLNDDFCQPYDYQRMLSKSSYHEPNPYAIAVYEKVEQWTDYLQQAGGSVRPCKRRIYLISSISND